mgnify:CR=1 FL=1
MEVQMLLMDYPAFEKLAIANNVKDMKELVANI